MIRPRPPPLTVVKCIIVSDCRMLFRVRNSLVMYGTCHSGRLQDRNPRVTIPVLPYLLKLFIVFLCQNSKVLFDHRCCRNCSFQVDVMRQAGGRGPAGFVLWNLFYRSNAFATMQSTTKNAQTCSGESFLTRRPARRCITDRPPFEKFAVNTNL